MIDYRIPLSCNREDCAACAMRTITDADGNKVRTGECNILTLNARKKSGTLHTLDPGTYTPTCPFFKTKEQQEEGRRKSEEC